MRATRPPSICRAVIVCSLLSPVVASAQTILYVDQNAIGPSHDGTSWCAAFVEVYEALAVAAPDTVIRVADGKYRPDRTGLTDMRTASFSLVNGVTLEGGYAGCGATDPDERDIAAFETVLSGDLFNDDGPPLWIDQFVACYTGGATTMAPGCAGSDFNFDGSVDGNDFSTLTFVVNYDDNSYHVVTSSSNDASASLDGFTISGGNATGTGINQQNGGGMYVVIGAPTISHCTFAYNMAQNGGGIYNDLNTQTLLADCAFLSNLAYEGQSGGFGGGALSFNGQPAIRRCLFWRNGSANGGGVFGQNSSVTIESSTFFGHRTLGGGGIHSSSSNTTVIDCLFSGNSAIIQGGGVRIVGGSPSLVNTTVAENDALIGGGIASAGATAVIHNAILWGNLDGGGASEAAQLDVATGTVSVFYSCIQALNLFAGNNNISADPMFVDPPGADALLGTPDDDLRLPLGSSCVDTGNNSPVVTVVDLDGNARILDGDGNGISTVDMGAYELDYIPPPSCFGVRDLSMPQLGYEPGITKTIQIELFPEPTTTALGIEDAPPPGWTDIANISNGGSYDAVAHKVKWGPLFAPFPATLTYDITPPINAQEQVCFDGVTSENGAQSVTTCGDLCIEVLPCPFLPADDPQPTCPGCADCSCDVCQDGQIVLCEMVGYACAWKSGCNDDIATMTRAAFLWQSGEIFCWDDSTNTWIPEPASPTNPGCCPAAQQTASAAARDPHPILGNTAVMRIKAVRGARRPRQISATTTIHAAIETVAVGLEINVPQGWAVTDITDDGLWDELNRKVKWGPFFEDLSRSVSFVARRESGEDSVRDFSGTVSFDGYNEPVVIIPTRSR